MPLLQDMFSEENSANKGMLSVIGTEQKRQMQNDAIEQQKQQRVVSGAATGIATGLAMGTPVGWALGGAMFLGSLF